MHDRGREFGRATMSVEEVDLKSGGGEHFGTKFGEVARAMTGVVGDGAGVVLVREKFLDAVGKSLGAFADGAVVDGVGAHVVHPASAATGAKGNDGPEDVVEDVPGARVKLGDECGALILEPGLTEPDADVFDGGREDFFIAGSRVEGGDRGGELGNVFPTVGFDETGELWRGIRRRRRPQSGWRPNR